MHSIRKTAEPFVEKWEAAHSRVLDVVVASAAICFLAPAFGILAADILYRSTLDEYHAQRGWLADAGIYELPRLFDVVAGSRTIFGLGGPFS